MSLMKTFPIWAPNAVATEFGWCDPRTKEVYVSIKKLKTRLESEKLVPTPEPALAPEVKYVEPVVIEEKPEIKEEVKMEQIIEEVKTKRPYNKKVVVGEAVEESKTVKIIGEVVEYDVDQPVIGE
jgi:hypothetical protein